MDRLGSALPLIVLVLAAGAAGGQTPDVPTGEPSLLVFSQAQQPDPTKPQAAPLPQPQQPTAANTLTDPANRPPRLVSRVNWKAPMMGDFPGYYTTGTLSAATTLTVVGRNGVRTVGTMTETVQVGVPVLTRAGIKVAENESPIPQDRFFTTYNYYYRTAVPQLGRTATFTPEFPGTPPVAGAPVSDILVSPVSAHVLTAGFEKSFLDGRASVGLRVPFFFSSQTFSSVPNPALLGGIFPGGQVTGQTTGVSQNLGGSAIGDLTALFKFALFRNEETGNVFTTGLAVTAPTGQLTLPAGAVAPDDVVLQPFIGYVLNGDRFYLHAFHSVLVPTNTADVTLFANDFGIGYRLIERDEGFLQSVIPTVEAHVTTPLDHRNTSGPFYYTDVVVLTGGSHFVFGRSSVLTLGVATPVTGPRPFQVEAQARFNWYY